MQIGFLAGGVERTVGSNLSDRHALVQLSTANELGREWHSNSPGLFRICKLKNTQAMVAVYDAMTGHGTNRSGPGSIANNALRPHVLNTVWVRSREHKHQGSSRTRANTAERILVVEKASHNTAQQDGCIRGLRL